MKTQLFSDTRSSFQERTDIFYFLSLKKESSVLLVGESLKLLEEYIKGRVSRTEIMDFSDLCGALDCRMAGRFDSIIIFMGKRLISAPIVLNIRKLSKSGGDIAFVFKNKINNLLLLQRIKKGEFIKRNAYALFDSEEKPNSIIPFHRAQMTYYLRNIRYPTMKRFKRILIDIALLFRMHTLIAPAFLLVCKKG